MSVESWDKFREYSILAVGAVLFILGCWATIVPPLVNDWHAASESSGTAQTVWRALTGPAGYVVCLGANAIWFGRSAAKAKTSERRFPRNLLEDSLVAIQVAVLLAACALVVADDRFVSLSPSATGTSGTGSLVRWIGSFALAGFVANGLALIDSRYQTLTGNVTDPKGRGWYWTNGVTIGTFVAGILLAIAATVLGLERTFDDWVGLGSVLALLLVGVVASIKEGF